MGMEQVWAEDQHACHETERFILWVTLHALDNTHKMLCEPIFFVPHKTKLHHVCCPLLYVRNYIKKHRYWLCLYLLQLTNMTTVRHSTIRTKQIPGWMELEMHAGGLYLRQHYSLMCHWRSADNRTATI